jgi:hypothetical protein
MTVNSLTDNRPGTDPEIGAGAIRPAQARTALLPKGSSTAERKQTQSAPAAATVPQDVVRVQLEPPGEIVVYQFVDQQGKVVLQVPPRQLLELAKQISQELQPKAPVPASSAGGKSNGR